jgi:hypothetical protein
MADIVRWLRTVAEDWRCEEAADEIERLLAENERLREALDGVIRIADRDCPEFRAARAALGEEKKG